MSENQITESVSNNNSDKGSVKKVKTYEKMPRIVSLDLIRGGAIFIVVIFHAINYGVFSQLNITDTALTHNSISDLPLILVAFVTPFAIMGTWASLFALVTGAATAYTIFWQVQRGRIDLKKKVKFSLISVAVLMLIHFLYSYLFVYPTANIVGNEYQGLVPASIRNGEFTPPDSGILFIAGALSMTAFSDLFVTLVFYMIMRKNEFKSFTRNAYIIGGCGIFFIFGTLIFQPLLTPIMIDSYNYGGWGYLIAMPLTWLVGTRNAIFPFVGYAFFGALFGMAMAQKNPDRMKIHSVASPIAYFFIVIGFLQIFIFGIEGLTDPVQPFWLYSMNLGLQLYLFNYLLMHIDFVPMEERKGKFKFGSASIGLRRWGVLSLTIFIFEEPVAATYQVIWDWLFPGLLSSDIAIIFAILVWLPILMAIWWMFLLAWERVNFKGSVEWIVAALIKGRSKGDILRISDTLYGPSGTTREQFYKEKSLKEMMKAFRKSLNFDGNLEEE